MTGPVAYDVLASPVGPLLAAMSHEGVIWLGYHRADSPRPDEELWERGIRAQHRPRALQRLRAEVAQYFARTRQAFSIPIDWSLAPSGFAGDALRVTATIPWGETLSYGEVAAEAGSPGAARAVGNAMRANPLVLLVPCHRVTASGGRLGGYMSGKADGLTVKRALLDLEGVPYRP